MNNQYKIEPDGNVTVITDAGEVITKEYNKNIDQILSLEDYIKVLNSKTNLFRKKLNESKRRKINNKKIMIVIPIATIVIETIILLGILPALKTVPLILICTVLGIISLEIPVVLSLIKNNNIIKECTRKIEALSYKKSKAKKRIDSLSKDKTKAKTENQGEFIKVKKIYSYNFDPEDYFVENYLIQRRAEEMTSTKKKVKKPLQIVNSLYDI